MLASAFTDHTMFIHMTILIIVPVSYISGILWTKVLIIQKLPKIEMRNSVICE